MGCREIRPLGAAPAAERLEDLQDEVDLPVCIDAILKVSPRAHSSAAA